MSSGWSAWVWVKWTAACFAVASLSCSLLVDPEALVTRCAVQSGEEDPCRMLGQSCQGGICQTCDPNEERCDGRDNDCDGMVDEGHDADGDGYTWCGGGRLELADCVPDDPTIHPNGPRPDNGGRAEELCDGVDNDCDGEVDEASSCDDSASCDRDEDCEQGLVCDPASERCVDPRSGGSWCRSDAGCAGGFCLSTDALRVVQLPNNVCATACCRDSHCPEDSVCVQSGNGVRVCLPRDIAGRQALLEGARCFSSAQCASGVCQDERCVSTCASDADCEGGMCRLNVVGSTLLQGAGGWICGDPAGRASAGASCSAFDLEGCQSALCRDGRCLGPCGSDADCVQGESCRYVTVQGLLGGGRVTACLPGGDNGGACCTSSDCSEGEVCRPVEVDGVWGMYCR